MSETASTTRRGLCAGYPGGCAVAACNRSKWKRIAVAGMLLTTVMSACAEDSPGETTDGVVGVAGGTGSYVPVGGLPGGGGLSGSHFGEGGLEDGNGASEGDSSDVNASATMLTDGGGDTSEVDASTPDLTAGRGDTSEVDASTAMLTDGGGDTSEVDASTAMLTDGGGDTAGPECDETGGARPQSCTVCIHQGWVHGLSEGAACTYLGIPYARPPVGTLRWAAPQAADGWDGVREATAYGHACPQVPDVSMAPTTSEDCLFLNVHGPAAARSELLPVLVFMHGGGFFGGASNVYGGQGLSEMGPAVVVTTNYRLGALGFFAHPDLDRQREAEPSGSDGIRDQQQALRWVQDNIASFGGDPDNVTLFGESAGSSSVCIHVVSPGSRDLARRFIMESGVCTGGVANEIAPLPREAMYSLTQQMAAEFCPGASDVLGCLRGLPADQLLLWAPAADSGSTGLGLTTWRPVIEGAGGVLPEHPDALIASGDFNPGEIIVGFNKNEYALFAAFAGSAWTVAEMRTLVDQRYGNRTDEIMALYAPDDSVDANQAYITLMTDVMFRCPSRRFARAMSAKGTTVYLYSFEQGTAQHTDEMVYVFGPECFGNGLMSVFRPIWPASLLEAFPRYWGNFAFDGDPNGSGLPSWPRYEATSYQHMVLVDPLSVGSGLQQAPCDFWDGYLDQQ